MEIRKLPRVKSWVRALMNATTPAGPTAPGVSGQLAESIGWKIAPLPAVARKIALIWAGLIVQPGGTWQVKQARPLAVIEVSKNGLPAVANGPFGKYVVITPARVRNGMLAGKEDGCLPRCLKDPGELRLTCDSGLTRRLCQRRTAQQKRPGRSKRNRH